MCETGRVQNALPHDHELIYRMARGSCNQVIFVEGPWLVSLKGHQKETHTHTHTITLEGSPVLLEAKARNDTKHAIPSHDQNCLLPAEKHWKIGLSPRLLREMSCLPSCPPKSGNVDRRNPCHSCPNSQGDQRNGCQMTMAKKRAQSWTPNKAFLPTLFHICLPLPKKHSILGGDPCMTWFWTETF